MQLSVCSRHEPTRLVSRHRVLSPTGQTGLRTWQCRDLRVPLLHLRRQIHMVLSVESQASPVLSPCSDFPIANQTTFWNSMVPHMLRELPVSGTAVNRHKSVRREFQARSLARTRRWSFWATSPHSVPGSTVLRSHSVVSRASA